MQRKRALQKLQILQRHPQTNSGLAKIESRYGEVGQEGQPSIPIMNFRLPDSKNLIFLSCLPLAFSPTAGSVWRTQISREYPNDVPLQMQGWHLLFAHNCLYCVKLTSCLVKQARDPVPHSFMRAATPAIAVPVELYSVGREGRFITQRWAG